MPNHFSAALLDRYRAELERYIRLTELQRDAIVNRRIDDLERSIEEMVEARASLASIARCCRGWRDNGASVGVANGAADYAHKAAIRDFFDRAIALQHENRRLLAAELAATQKKLSLVTKRDGQSFFQREHSEQRLIDTHA